MTSGKPARARTRNVARREVDPARVAAWRTLRAVSEQDAYANLVLPRLLRQGGLRGRDAAFATELAYGALRSRGTYDAIVEHCANRPLAEVDEAVIDALRLGAHQMFGMRVPAHAAVAATVDLVRAEIGQGAAGFANAVLRRMSERPLEAWLSDLAPDPDADPDGALAVRWAHPLWMVRAFGDALRLWGRDRAELPALLAADNQPPRVTLAALPGLSDVAELVAAGGTAGRWSPLAVTWSGGLEGVEAVRSGRARVQDEGSQLVSLALTDAAVEGRDGGRWLDLCAGPGGKSAVLAAVLAQRDGPGGQGRLVAIDPAPHRVDLVRSSVAAVTGVDIEVRCADGREAGAQEPGAYDRVLVDVPCTGLGALRRRPEARWRRTPADLAALGPLQRGLLGAGLDAVRPGGVVAYVTCSPHPAETRFVVTDCLRRRPGVEQVDARPLLASVTSGRMAELGPGPDVQLWPHVHGTDAMYLSLLRRAS